ncbi:MAG: metalloprotease family protein [bacterium]|nr:metalloprotease family protein [bacterium]
MFFYSLISILTFPGVIIHEAGHKIFCEMTGVKVFKTRYFKFGNPAGYVIHADPNGFIQSFFITAGPFIVGTLVALLFFIFSKAVPDGSYYKYVLIWLGGAVGMHAFPSPADAKVLWRSTNERVWHNPFVICGYPFVFILWIFSVIRATWSDLLYAVILYAVVIK